MYRVSKEPDIIFLQVGCNDFPRTAWNRRDADALPLQLLELTSPLIDRYKAKRVVVGCLLPCFSARRSRRGLSTLEVRQYSGWAQAVNTGLTDHSQKVTHITHSQSGNIMQSSRFRKAGEGSSMTTGYTYPYRVSTSCNHCCLSFPVVSCTRKALTVAISSGCLYEYVSVLDITKVWAYFTLTFLWCYHLRGLSHVLLLHYRHFCPLWAVDGCPPSDTFFTCFAPPLQALLPPLGR